MSDEITSQCGVLNERQQAAGTEAPGLEKQLQALPDPVKTYLNIIISKLMFLNDGLKLSSC